MFFKKDVPERVMIKSKIPHLPQLVGHGLEYTYKPGCVGSGEGKKYWRNFGNWKKNIKKYKIVILGENYYNFDVSRYIKQKNPNCKVIVYFWNKLVFDSYFQILEDPNVDEFYTFDEGEAKEYNFSWNTTFYSKRVVLPDSDILYDVIFLGRAKDGEKEILDLEKKLKKLKIQVNFNIVKNEKDYIEYSDYLKMLSQSRVLLDYNAYDQVGLSLRTMESLFFEKKLITSNKNIKNYDFYNKNNIFILGEDDFKDISNFIHSDYEKIDQEIIDYYDFEQWIKRFR